MLNEDDILHRLADISRNINKLQNCQDKEWSTREALASMSLSESDVEYKYRFVAECYLDIVALLQKLPCDNILGYVILPACGTQYPDRLCEIKIRDMALGDLKKIIEKIPDSHVMLDTSCLV